MSGSGGLERGRDVLAGCHTKAVRCASSFSRLHDITSVVPSPTVHAGKHKVRALAMIRPQDTSSTHDPESRRLDQLRLQKWYSSAQTAQRPAQKYLCFVAYPPPANRAHLLSPIVQEYPRSRPSVWSHKSSRAAGAALSTSLDSL